MLCWEMECWVGFVSGEGVMFKVGIVLMCGISWEAWCGRCFVDCLEVLCAAGREGKVLGELFFTVVL